MPQQHARQNNQDDDEQPDPLPSEQSARTRDADGNNGFDHDAEALFKELDQILQEAPEWEHFVQKGGQ